MFLDGNQKVIKISCKYEKLILNSNEDLNELLGKTYKIYCNTLIGKNIYFNKRKLLLKTEKDLHTMKELGFEHIVSIKNNKLGIRVYDKNRMIYISLIEKILNDCCNGQCKDIKVYRDRKDICVWCKHLDYLIVLADRKKGYLLQTAYPVIYNKKRKSIEKKANENGIF